MYRLGFDFSYEIKKTKLNHHDFYNIVFSAWNDWATQNMLGPIWVDKWNSTQFELVFDNPQDIMLFKLRWNGVEHGTNLY